MSVDRRDAADIAALARLRFDGEELERITGEMNQVLGHVEALKSLEIDDVPASGPDPLEGEGDATRGPAADLPDELRLDLPALAPQAQDGFFLVPPLPGVHAGEGE
jgi:aspartyl/glutamyl-tRNA(Asn/Gln) amidotransferase C subunit